MHPSPTLIPRCSGCQKDANPGYKRCSGCRSLYYCSRVCQVAHWKEHKDLCKIIRDSNERIETETLSSPLTPIVVEDLKHWLEAYQMSILDAIYSVLEANTRRDKTRSHVAQIRLIWKGDHGDPSKLFRKSDIRVLSNAEFISDVEKSAGGPSIHSSATSLASLQSFYPWMKSRSDELYIKVGYHVRAYHKRERFGNDDWRCVESLGSLLLLRSWDHLVPSSRERFPFPPIDPQWESNFKLDTSSPPLSVQAYEDLRDLRESLILGPAERAFLREVEAFEQTPEGRRIIEAREALQIQSEVDFAQEAKKRMAKQ